MATKLGRELERDDWITHPQAGLVSIAEVKPVPGREEVRLSFGRWNSQATDLIAELDEVVELAYARCGYEMYNDEDGEIDLDEELNVFSRDEVPEDKWGYDFVINDRRNPVVRINAENGYEAMKRVMTIEHYYAEDNPTMDLSPIVSDTPYGQVRQEEEGVWQVGVERW